MAKPTLKAIPTNSGKSAVAKTAQTVKAVWQKVRAGDKSVISKVEENTANNLYAKKGDIVDVTFRGLHKMQSGKTLFRVAFNGKQSPSLYSMCGYKNPQTKEFGLRFKSTGIRV